MKRMLIYAEAKRGGLTSLLGWPRCLAQMSLAPAGWGQRAVLQACLKSASSSSPVLLFWLLAPLAFWPLPCLCISRGNVPGRWPWCCLNKRVRWDFPDILETNCERRFALKCSWQVYRWLGGFSCVLSYSANPQAGPLLALSCDRSLPRASWAYGERGGKRKRESERGFEGER